MWHLFSHIKRKDWKVALKKKIKSLKGAADSLVAESCRPNLVCRSHPGTQCIQGSACRDPFARFWACPQLDALQEVAVPLTRSQHCPAGSVCSWPSSCWWVCAWGSQAQRAVAHGGHPGQELPATEPFSKKVALVCAPLPCISVVYRWFVPGFKAFHNFCFNVRLFSGEKSIKINS